MAMFVGALLGVGLLSRLMLWLFGKFVRGWPLLLLAHAASAVVAVVGSAFGHADGGPLAWEMSAIIYIPAQLVVLGLDLIRWRRDRTIFA